MNRTALGVRYAYVAIFVVLAVFYGFVVASTIGWSFESRKSVAAFFTVPLSLVLLGFAAFGRSFSGRFALVLATGAFGFVPAIASSAWQRIEAPIVWPATPESNDGFLSFFITSGLLIAIAGAAPHVVDIERPLDRVVRIVAPLLLVAQVAMFVFALAHGRRPDPDTFVASLRAPRSLAPGEAMSVVGSKSMHYAIDDAGRSSCRVLDETLTAYSDAFECGRPVDVTMDDYSGMVMVGRGSTWWSSTALRPADIGRRLSAPVGWIHLAGGGALLAGIALVVAAAFAGRSRAVEPPRAPAPGGYRVPAPMPPPEDGDALDPEARRRDFYEARARGARAVALTIAAATSLPLAAALAHGVGV